MSIYIYANAFRPRTSLIFERNLLLLKFHVVVKKKQFLRFSKAKLILLLDAVNLLRRKGAYFTRSFYADVVGTKRRVKVNIFISGNIDELTLLLRSSRCLTAEENF